MAAIKEIPPILTGTTQEQIVQLREYLIRNMDNDKGCQASVYFTQAVEQIQQTITELKVVATPNLQDDKVVTPTTAQQIVEPSSGYDGMSVVTVEPAPTEVLTVTPSGSTQTFTPSGDNVGFSPVTVLPAPTETLEVTPSGAAQSFTPSAGKVGFSQVTVQAASGEMEEKTVTPGTAAFEVTPSAGKLGLSKVTVNATPLDQPRTIMPSVSDQRIVPGTGNIGISELTVAGDADLVAGNIRKNVQIFGVTGSYEGATSNENGLHYAEADNTAGGKTVDITTTQLGYGMTHTTTQDSGGGDIETFNGYEIGEAAGSLIVCELSTAINRVVAKYGTESETALISNHVAYINIPYPFTSGTVTIIAYVDSQQVTSGSVTISGIDKYSCPLTV